LLTTLNSQTNSDLPTPEQTFEWPNEAIRGNNWTEAASRWAVLRKAYPEHPAPWIHGARAKIEAGDLEQAEKLLLHAQQHFPNHANLFLESALLAMRSEKWDTAEAYLQQAREKHPDLLQTWFKSAECAEVQGNLEQAAAYYQKACECTPDRPGPFIQYAELAMRTKQWEQALQIGQKIINDFPNSRMSEEIHSKMDVLKQNVQMQSS